jgi:hypothetical protein
MATVAKDAQTPDLRIDLMAELHDDCGLTTAKAAEVVDLLVDKGHVVPHAAPARKLLTDAQTFAERTVLAELVVRLFRTLVLGGIVLEDTPKAMSWLKSFIDGDQRNHGPLGAGPMMWPDHLPTVCGLLIKWGFMRTPGQPGYVFKRPQG